MTVIGHEHVLGWLERELPQVTLLLGPESVGKRQLACHLLAERGGVTVEVRKLDAGEARRVAHEALVAPFGARKNFLIDLDGAGEVAQNILLKTLEEPPVTARFVLIASERPLPTVLSRCARIPVGLLTDEQVRQVLVSKGYSEEEAQWAAPLGAGQVAPALDALRDADGVRKSRAMVAAALKSALSTEYGLLSASMRGWDPTHTAQLRMWAEEAASGRWHRFDESFAPGATREKARTLLVLLSRYAGARTAAAVALDRAFADGD